jgi:acyl-CoA hydrolase
VTERIADRLFAGCRVAIADGAGAPVGLSAELTEAARAVGGVELLLGWCLEPPVDLDDAQAFPVIRTFMGGYALRRPIGAGRVSYFPARVGALPGLLTGPLRPDIVVLSAREVEGGLAYGTEAAWLPAAVAAAHTVLVELNDGLPVGSRSGAIPRDKAAIISRTDRGPRSVLAGGSDPESAAVGRHVAALIGPGAAIQFGPGRIADAALAAITEPVHVDSGVINDAVVALDRRGLLLSPPTTAYVVGSPELYAWTDGRDVLRGVEYTHDVTRLAAREFVAINTALEIDHNGQVNVERYGKDAVSGVGGHGDFAIAASRSARGLSIVALPRERGGRRTLVEQLSAPVSTGYADVDVVVTARGSADLRGVPVGRRAAVISALWEE